MRMIQIDATVTVDDGTQMVGRVTGITDSNGVLTIEGPLSSFQNNMLAAIQREIIAGEQAGSVTAVWAWHYAD
jgi:hypothetical protein